MNITFLTWRKNSQLIPLEANILIKHVTGYSSARLISQLQDKIPEHYLKPLNELKHRRLAGEPIAYILGTQEFYSRSFITTPDVLIPRSETEHLVDYILQYCNSSDPLTIWDIGTGSGIIAITLKLERPHWRAYASDISEKALNIARKNSQQLNAEVNFSIGPWFDLNPPFKNKTFDIIVSNPPYIRQDDPHLSQGDLRFEPKIALTDFNDGLDSYRTLAQGAIDYLKSGGLLCLEHGYNQAHAIQNILTNYQFTEITTCRDYAHLDRITVAKKT